ncbi:hypothetical protein Bateq7PJ16_2759 [Bacillus subtilis]|nr:hypothetical protein Bateq7PJ16_2759 [Bacillus subtilis]
MISSLIPLGIEKSQNLFQSSGFFLTPQTARLLFCFTV